jgi:hypothetical protein
MKTSIKIVDVGANTFRKMVLDASKIDSDNSYVKDLEEVLLHMTERCAGTAAVIRIQVVER